LAPDIFSASLSLKNQEPRLSSTAMKRNTSAVPAPPIRKPIATSRPVRVASSNVVLSVAVNVDRLVVVKGLLLLGV
jgi:hypothetical protein